MGEREKFWLLLTVLSETKERSPLLLWYSTSFTQRQKPCQEYWRLLGTVVSFLSVSSSWGTGIHVRRHCHSRKCSFPALCSITKTACCMMSWYGIVIESEHWSNLLLTKKILKQILKTRETERCFTSGSRCT